MIKLFVVLYSERQAKVESNMPRCVVRISSAKEFNFTHRSLIELTVFKMNCLDNAAVTQVEIKQQQFFEVIE